MNRTRATHGAPIGQWEKLLLGFVRRDKYFLRSFVSSWSFVIENMDNEAECLSFRLVVTRKTNTKTSLPSGNRDLPRLCSLSFGQVQAQYSVL
jgi:hypothetical protein